MYCTYTKYFDKLAYKSDHRPNTLRPGNKKTYQIYKTYISITF